MPRRRTALGLTAAALLSTAASASAAETPVLYYEPWNPRSSTEVAFYGYDGSSPDSETAPAFRWDFAGGSAFTGAPTRTPRHTFGTDGVHPITVQSTAADGSTAHNRLIVGTHPDNWAPKLYVHDVDNAVTGFPTYVYAGFSDDSPPEGLQVRYDANGDGQFGDGTPTPYGGHELTFGDDGAHQVTARVDDGEGQVSTATFTVRTHTANEKPFFYAYGSDEQTIAQHWSTTAYAGAEDDYTGSDRLTYEWEVDGTVITDANSPWLTLGELSLGDHQVKVTVTDAEGLSNSRVMTYHVVESMPAPQPQIYLENEAFDAAPTFQTLENAALYASLYHEGGVSYAWDLDADGAFDDASGSATNFAAANKGTYRVAVRITPTAGEPVVLHRTVVVDSGKDYDAKPVDTGSGTPPVPETPASPPVTPVVTTQQQSLSPVGKVLGTFGPVALSTGAPASGGVPGVSAPGVNLKQASLVFGSLLSPSPADVSVTFTALVPGKAKAGKASVARAAAKKKPRARKIALGKAALKLPANTPTPLKVKLGSKAKKALKGSKKVKVTAAFVVRDVATGKTSTGTERSTLKVKR